MPLSAIPGAFPPINDPDLNAGSWSMRQYRREFINFLAGLGRAQAELTATSFTDSETFERKHLAAIAESIAARAANEQDQDTQIQLAKFNAYGAGAEVPISSTGDIQNNWSIAPYLFDNRAYVAVRISGSAMGCTGISAPSAFSGTTLFLTALESTFQIRLSSSASDASNQITHQNYATVSPTPTIIGTTECPADTAIVLPGQTAVLVYSGTNWVLVAIAGESAVSLRRTIQQTTISASGLLNAVSSNVFVTTASLAELRAVSLSQFTPSGVGAVQHPATELRAMNDTGANITIVHLSGAVSASLRIATPAGTNLTWPPGTEARILRDGTNNRWRMTHASF